MGAPWIDAYTFREWELHELELDDPALKKLWTEALEHFPDHNVPLFVCGAESGAARDHWERTGSMEDILFYDAEQLWAMDLEKAYGVGRIGELRKEWMGHAPGSLVMEVYKGVNEDPQKVTICVAEC